MKSYTFAYSVAFTDHSYQSKVGDTCVYNADTESLVVYREDNLLTQFQIRNVAVDSMEEKGWLKTASKEPVKTPEVVVETVVVPAVDSVVPVVEVEDETTEEVEEVGENTEEVETETTEEAKTEAVVKRGGRPKKK
jgi:hypothetical protein